MSLSVDARIRVESVRTLYRQLPNSFAAAMVVTLYMIATAWPYTQLRAISGWLGAQALAQAHRFWIYRRYTRAELTIESAESWSRRYSEYMAVAGLVWGSSIFLFVHLDVPISLALTMCGLYGIAAGSVPGNAYNPPGVYLFLGLIFGLVMLRMALIGDAGHIALGIASILFVAIMVLFCRVQYRTLMDGFLIRFENADLLEQLKVQKKDAEDARARAEQASLAKSQFLAAASHDLRQPLHALGLFSASLQELKLDDNGREIVARIHNNIDALEQLFNALLDISKLDAGVVRPDPSSVPVGTLFARLEDYFFGIAREKGLRLRFLPTVAHVRGDPILLERILSNLVANALRYTERGGAVIACRHRGAGKLSLEVWDSGIGVTPRDQARIFDEFVQVGNPERDRRKGLGLGLAIAQRTAALLGTRIEVSSRPGRGSVFRFALPRAHPEALPMHRHEPEAIDAVTGLKVLVIDDEESIRDALARLLGQWGAEIEAVPGPEEAEALFRSGRRFDVVLADFRLRHDKTGIEAIRTIRTLQSPPPRACLVTGDVDAALIGAARTEGLPLLHKPMRPAQLRAVLNFLASQPAESVSREPAPAAG